jgi:hypothetical protein
MNPAPGYDDYLPLALLHFVAEAEWELDGAMFGQLAAGGDAGTFIPTEQSQIPGAMRDRRRRLRRTREPKGRRSDLKRGARRASASSRCRLRSSRSSSGVTGRARTRRTGTSCSRIRRAGLGSERIATGSSCRRRSRRPRSRTANGSGRSTTPTRGADASGVDPGGVRARLDGNGRAPLVRHDEEVPAPRRPVVPDRGRRARRSASRGRTFYRTFYQPERT